MDESEKNNQSEPLDPKTQAALEEFVQFLLWWQKETMRESQEKEI